jgi:large subunit ribosomal protein L9
MKVILLQDIAKLGKRGTVAEVADGYALNVLIKKSQAVQATPTELSKWKQAEESKKYKKEIITNTFLQLLERLGKEEIVITDKKSDSKGQLFAQVKESDIADAIFKVTKFSIDPKQVIISSQIKSLGKYSVTLKQGEQKKAITVIVGK